VSADRALYVRGCNVKSDQREENGGRGTVKMRMRSVGEKGKSDRMERKREHTNLDNAAESPPAASNPFPINALKISIACPAE
jgi:hypothetical protein